MNELKELLAKLNVDINIQKNNNAGFVAEVLGNFMIENNITLADIEKELREMNSRIYLLALRTDSYGLWEGKKLLSIRFHEKEIELPYALWVCMNGEDEAIETMKKSQLLYSKNNDRLKECGFLTIPN